MKLSLTIKIDSDNAVVVDDPIYELAQAAERIARRLRNGDLDGSVLDSNGNTVGTFKVTITGRRHES